jgi:hypothetical protein
MKKLIIFSIISLLFSNNSFAMSEGYEKSFYNGCYPESKQYLGSEKAKIYCTCVIKMISKRYTDKNIDIITQKSQEYQLQAFNFASIDCNDKV